MMSTVVMLVALGAALSVSVYVLIRNERVYRQRTAMLSRIRRAAANDINLGREWQWRYDEFDRVSYEAHLFRVGPVAWPHDPARVEQ